jgi:hypothetical protein
MFSVRGEGVNVLGPLYENPIFRKRNKNFLLWLRDQRQAAFDREKAISPLPIVPARNLCLLVVANAPLVAAWLATLNNDAVIQSQREEKRELAVELSRISRSGTVDKKWLDLLGEETFPTWVI